MANCVNVNSKEFRSLQEKVDVPEGLLAAMVGVYQTDNNTDKFPTPEELLGNSSSVKKNAVVLTAMQNDIVEEELRYNELVKDGYKDAVKGNRSLVKGIVTKELVNDKVKRLKGLLDAVVLVDNNLKTAGKLLASDHPLSIHHSKPVIIINTEKAFSDTVEHEFSHIVVELLADNPVYDELLNFAKNSPEYNRVSEKYPELSELDKAKETAASLLGKDLAIKLNKDLEMISGFRGILQRIMDFLSSIFKKNDVISSINREFLKNKLELSPVELFNNAIERNQKFDFTPDPNNMQKSIVDFIKFMNDSIILNEDTHIYSDKEGNVYNESVTSVVNRLKDKRIVDNKKGSFDVPFSKDFLTTLAFNRSLNSSAQMPKAFDDVLNEFFQGELPNTSNRLTNTLPNNQYWHDYYLSASVEEQDNIIEDVREYLNLIKDYAEEKNNYYNKFSQAGTYMHKLVELYFKDELDEFPANIEGSDKLLKVLSKIKNNAKTNGSVILTETSILSNNSHNPGQIDIIEITKDGKYRIYDLKTVSNKIFSSNRYVHVNAYMPQQLAYSTILKQYGLEEVDEHPYNVVLVDSDRSQYEEDGEKYVKVKDVKIEQMDLSKREERNVMRGIGTKVVNSLMDKRQFKEFNIHTIDEKAVELAEELERAVDQYAKLTGIRDIQQAKFKNSPAYNKHFSRLVDKLEKLRLKEKNNGSLKIVNDFIDTFINTATDIEESNILTSPGYIPSDFIANLRNFEHIGQRLDSIQVFLNEVIQENVELSLGIDSAELSDKLKNAISFYNTFKEDYRRKRISSSAAVLSADSLIFTYLYKEHYEAEARELGITDIDSIKAFAIKKISLPENKSFIEQKEYDYWVNVLTYGMNDIAVYDHMLADPGINKAKVVQVTKVLMDRADKEVRMYVDEYMPDLIKKEQSFIIEGNTSKEKYSKFLYEDPTASLSAKVLKNGIDPEVLADMKANSNRMLIPEFTSEMYKADLTFKVHNDYYYDKLDLLRREGAKQEDIDEVQEKINKIQEDRNEFYKRVAKQNKNVIAKLFEKSVHPAFAKLSESDKDALRFFSNAIVEQEMQIENDLPLHLRLVHKSPEGRHKRFKNAVGEDDMSIQTVYLPKMTRSYWETNLDPAQGLKDKFEKVKNIFRPTGDDADFNYLAETKTDLNNREINDIPVFYRRTLADKSLQSYDIPTMIALNMESVQRYKAYRGIEADLYMIVDSVRDTTVHKKDSFVDKSIKSLTTGAKVVTDTNRIADSLEKMMKARLYSLRYANVNSKTAYKTAQMLQTLKSATSDIFLILNYNSAITTSFQGTLYRMIEGLGGEYMNMNDVKNGSKKAWGDYGSMLKDILYNNFPTSKSVLMLRRFGLEAEFKALSKKFVENNVFKKTMDKGQLYVFTAMGEYLVTSSLMYSVMNNIKAMNANKEYIDINGNVVSKEKAMTLDEAYTVEDGKLVVNKHLVYTDRNLSDKYMTKLEGDNTNESLKVGLFISGLYKNLYGQYDSKLKSNLEMTVLGESLVHLRKWAIRGANNRFRGLSSTLGMTFAERRDESNIDKRFYSQEMGGFKEGYITTTMSYLYNVYREAKDIGSILSAASTVYDQLTTHERANIKRTIGEAIIVGTVAIAALILARLAYQDDDDDNEFLWFATYSLLRVKDEALYYFNVTNAREIMQTPIVGMSVLDNVYKLFKQVAGFEYDYKTDEVDWRIDNTYVSGPHKDQNKAFRQATNLIPGKVKVERMLNLLGITEYDEGRSFKNSAEMMANPVNR